MEGNSLKLKSSYRQIGRKLELLVQTGQILMENGADSDRIVRTMKRAAVYMNVPSDKLHIHITYTTIMANVSDGDQSITKFQKCYKHGVDMDIIAKISKLAVRAQEQTYALEVYARQLDAICGQGRAYTVFMMTVGAGLACGGVCKLLGGDWMAFFYTSFSAMVGFLMRRQCHRMDINPYVGIFFATFAATCAAFLTHYLPGSSTPWHPMMACALFIMPGIPMINAVEDLLDNYIVSGMTRAVNATLMVGSMSFGIVFAIDLCRVEDFTTLSMDPHASYFAYALAAAVAAVGFSTIFNTPRRFLWLVALGGILAVCVRNFINAELGLGMGISSFVGAMVVRVASLQAAHWSHTPSHVLTIPSVIPMIPGVLMYRTLFGMININELDPNLLMLALQSGVNAFMIILSIALGVAVPNIFAHKYLDRQEREDLRRGVKPVRAD